MAGLSERESCYFGYFKSTISKLRKIIGPKTFEVYLRAIEWVCRPNIKNHLIISNYYPFNLNFETWILKVRLIVQYSGLKIIDKLCNKISLNWFRCRHLQFVLQLFYCVAERLQGKFGRLHWAITCELATQCKLHWSRLKNSSV